MRRALPYILFFVIGLILPMSASARARVSGFCEQGGAQVTVANGAAASTTAAGVRTNWQRSFPGCTVTVYTTGTTTTVTIYSDNSGTVTANPFTTSTTGDGSWFFYADNSRVDITMSGGGIPTQFTRGDIYVQDGSVFNDLIIVDGKTYTTIAAAVTAAGSNKRIILIPSTYSGGDCPALVATLVFWDFRGSPGGGVCSNNTVMYDFKTAGLTNSMTREQMTVNSVDATGSALVRYSLTTCNNCTNGNVLDGVSDEAQLTGTYTGTFPLVNGNEMVASLFSTGGTVTLASGGEGYCYNLPGNTTLVTECRGLDGVGAKMTGTAPTNSYGLYGREQFGAAAVRNYSAGLKGPALLLYSSNLGKAGLDMEDTSNAVHNFIYLDSGNLLNFQAPTTLGITFRSSDAVARASLTSSGWSFGIVGSSSANPAASGFLRLSNTDKLTWRDAANAADHPIGEIQTKRTGSCTTGAAAASTCTTTMTWASAFADVNYTVSCTIGNVTAVPYVLNMSSKVAASVVVTIANLTAVAASGTIECVAIHD